MQWKAAIVTYGAVAALAACASETLEAPEAVTVAEVTAVAETEPVGTANEDAADDPAIWRNAVNPVASLIVATDKKAGLYVYDLQGRVKSFLDAGAVNNVDLVELDNGTVFVAASDRADLANSHIATFTLDTATGELTALGRIPSGPGEGYGFCLSQHGGLSALAVMKDGRLREYALDPANLAQTRLLREFSVPSQPEGCVFDDRDGMLYVGEEAAGIWRYADGASEGELVAKIDDRYMVADVEGLALDPQGEAGGYLIASSQGDNAYAVFSLPDVTPLGRFRIAKGALGATEETDGIALMAGDFGPDFPQGLFVAQDGENAPEAQNFKLADWGAIKQALGLD